MVDCDPELKKTFFGECTGNPFFVKVRFSSGERGREADFGKFFEQTHFPALGWNESARQYYKEFDQAVHVGSFAAFFSSRALAD